ncbi:MAG: DHH family phosphoesterase [Candidatus Diapherotrites archaeon]|nr:DHH family phosphoesterase [Candidatus Diapherotrites archaeon]
MNLNSFFSSLPKKTLALTHAGADVDAIASAGALYFLFKNKISIGVPEHLNLNAKQLAEKMQIPFELNPDLHKFDALILLDFNSSSQIGKLAFQLKNFSGKIALIDHHTSGNEVLAVKSMSLIDSKAVSTTELIYRLIKSQKKSISKEIATLLAAGIYTDSAGFYASNKNTFTIFSDLMNKSDKSFPELISLISTETDFSEKIAKLKAAKRLKIFKSGEFLLVSTNVGSFQANAAATLLRLGADAAFAGDVEKGLLLISGRANHFLLNQGFDLAKHVFEPLQTHFNGNGGGHAGAAAFNGKARAIEPVLQKCIELTHEFIHKKDKKASLKEYE